jgi:hypothetical protein
MKSAQELTLREKIRRVLVEEVPEASEETVERTVNKLIVAMDPFERAAADVLQRYARTFAELAK